MRSVTLPDNLFRLIQGYEWQRITIGLSEATTYRLTGSSGHPYLKIVPTTAVESLEHEKDRLIWLQEKLPVPEVLYYGKDETHEYMLISEIAGKDASDRSFENELPNLMRQLAKGLRTVHEVDIGNCPFDQTLEAKIAEVRRRVENKLVDEQDFDDIRQGSSAEQQFQQLLQLKPQQEDLVFTHGDYCLPNVVLHNGRISGFIDWGRAGIADRHQDLALAVRSITYNFGPEQVKIFVDEYGAEQFDESKLFYYQLMDEFF